MSFPVFLEGGATKTPLHKRGLSRQVRSSLTLRCVLAAHAASAVEWTALPATQ
jgi:hypothetical protein